MSPLRQAALGSGSRGRLRHGKWGNSVACEVIGACRMNRDDRRGGRYGVCIRIRLFINLCCRTCGKREQQSQSSRSNQYEFLFHRSNLLIKEDISLELLSKKYFIDKDHLNKLFSKEIGIPVHRYVQVKRLILARDEIRKGSGIEEAAYKAGFKDYSNFYRAYRSFFGIKPSSQRNEVTINN